MKGVYFVSGIDTDIGKTVATGMLAKQLLQQGKSVITQKPVQTGCQNIADDIAVHRNIMGIPCLLYTSPSPRDYAASRMPSSA